MRPTRLILAAAGVLASSLVAANTTQKIPREHGAVHSQFRSMFASLIAGLPSGVGRIELTGTADGDNCIVNFYTNKDTTFVTLDIDAHQHYNEFYIDHPTQSFKSVLFQNLVIDDDVKELKVVTREIEYSILVGEDRLVLGTKLPKDEDTKECAFDLTKAKLHDGETE